MIDISLNQNNSSFLVKDQMAKSIRISKIISDKIIDSPTSYHLSMLDEKDLTVWSRSFSEFRELKNGLEWEVDKNFVFSDHITIQINNNAQADFDVIVEIEKT